MKCLARSRSTAVGRWSVTPAVRKRIKAMSIIGISAAKDHLYLAMTTSLRDDFTVIRHHRIPIKSADWPNLLANLSTHLDSYDSEDEITGVGLVCCASGMYGASPEAFKAEGFAELRCQEKGFSITLITKQSLKGHLNCQSGQKWQQAAKALFNSQKEIMYFSAGFDAAISGAYVVSQ